MIFGALGNGKHVWLTWATSGGCNLIPSMVRRRLDN